MMMLGALLPAAEPPINVHCPEKSCPPWSTWLLRCPEFCYFHSFLSYVLGSSLFGWCITPFCVCSVIQFLGAFYREGAVTIITEYMDGGSLLNVLQQVNMS